MYVKLVCLYKIFTVPILFIIFLLSSFSYSFANGQSSITATVSISICGNGVIEDGEVCDSRNINGKNCTDFGYQKGILLCGLACDEYNTYYCFNEIEESVAEILLEDIEDDEYEFNLEVKDSSPSDFVDELSIEIMPIKQIESAEHLTSNIYNQEVPLSRAPT